MKATIIVTWVLESITYRYDHMVANNSSKMSVKDEDEFTCDPGIRLNIRLNAKRIVDALPQHKSPK